MSTGIAWSLPAALLSVSAALSHNVSAQCLSQWVPLPGTQNAHVLAMTPWDADGPGPAPAGLVVAGSFTSMGGVNATNVAFYEPVAGTWSALGGGIATTVTCLTSLPNGDLIAGGINGVARFVGGAWQAVGSGLDATVLDVVAWPNGDIAAAGDFSTVGVRRWNGTQWLPLGAGTVGVAAQLAILAGGDLVAGGAFSSIGGALVHHLARWNGTDWQGMGVPPTPGPVVDMEVLANGALVVATSSGGTTPMSGVAMRNGATWMVLGTGAGPAWSAGIVGLEVMPDGDLFIAGDWATGYGGALSPARLNGAAWASVGTSFGPVYRVGKMPTGEPVVRDGTSLWRLQSTCPATAVATSAGCSGSAGLNALTVQSLPWTGGTFRATATGLHNNTIALSIFGLSTAATPLVSLLPQGLPTCELNLSTELVLASVPTAGLVNTELAVPNSSPLAGFVLHHQVVALELDPQNNITAVSSTNALALTIGTL